jgi:uncharacterized protein YndB with AHSA1/START domain
MELLSSLNIWVKKTNKGIKMNSSNDLTVSLTVNKTPKEVYDAINDVKAWWIGEISGNSNNVGAEFVYRYKDFHTSTQKVTELVPNKKVVWHVEDALLSFTENKKEWKGTDIIFEITPKGDSTELKFTHKGLTPKVECFEACSEGWGFYVTKSLNNLLINGKGIDPGF